MMMCMHGRKARGVAAPPTSSGVGASAGGGCKRGQTSALVSGTLGEVALGSGVGEAGAGGRNEHQERCLHPRRDTARGEREGRVRGIVWHQWAHEERREGCQQHCRQVAAACTHTMAVSGVVVHCQADAA